MERASDERMDRMGRYYTKEDRETIEKLNSILGMKHRSKPYDFNKMDELADAFMMIIAEYIDYQNYHMTVENVIEAFDESLEYYDPVTWMSLHSEDIKGDKLAVKTSNALGKTGNFLFDLSKRAKQKCKDMLVLILGMSTDYRQAVLGKAYLYNEDVIEAVFEDCMEIIDVYCLEESRDAFMKILDKHLLVEEHS